MWLPGSLSFIVLIFFLATGSAPRRVPVSRPDSSSATSPDTHKASAYLEAIRSDKNELRAFFHAMPKGGDIHHHLTGAVYAEDLIDIAARHGMYVDPGTGQLSVGTTPPALVPVSAAYDNPALYQNLVRAWSMHDFPRESGQGSLHFFSAFLLTSSASLYQGEMIAAVRNRAAGENVMYIETMVTVPEGAAQVKKIVAGRPWDDNLSVMRLNLLDAGLREICRQNAAHIAAYDAESLALCTPSGKNVAVRYLFAVSRISERRTVFANMVQAFETANQSSLVVGVNIMGPDDSYYGRTDCRLSMRMVEYLRSVYPEVRVALHAGEQTIGTVPPEDLWFHVADAIATAHADRIGHGVDIMSEDDAFGTIARMAEKQVPVEILLTSNYQILGVPPDQHPVSVYAHHNVPVIIATDDPGIERTDLTEQYVLLASHCPAISWEQIRRFNRNSIRYSFLPEKEKQEMLARLDERLSRFERSLAGSRVPPISGRRRS